MGDLIMLKKLNFHLSYRVFLKDKKIAYFDHLKKKKRAKQRNFGQLEPKNDQKNQISSPLVKINASSR